MQPHLPPPPLSDYDSRFHFFYQPALLRNLINILLASFVMIWVEILVLRYFLWGKINSLYVNQVRDLGAKDHNDAEVQMTPVFEVFAKENKQRLYAFVAGLNENETDLVNRNNRYTLLMGFIPWLLVSFLLLLFYWRLQTDAKVAGAENVLGNHMRATLYTGVLSFLVFGCFQILFVSFSLAMPGLSNEAVFSQVQLNLQKEVCPV
jgi:hypothetical protein